LPTYFSIHRFIQTAARLEGEPVWTFPFKRGKGADLPVEQALHNRMLAPSRAMVECPFRIVKRQFGYITVRYRGLFKFAVGNLYHVRQAMRPT
jgi:IS5 family transposase